MIVEKFYFENRERNLRREVSKQVARKQKWLRSTYIEIPGLPLIQQYYNSWEEEHIGQPEGIFQGRRDGVNHETGRGFTEEDGDRWQEEGEWYEAKTRLECLLRDNVFSSIPSRSKYYYLSSVWYQITTSLWSFGNFRERKSRWWQFNRIIVKFEISSPFQFRWYDKTDGWSNSRMPFQ